MKKKNELSETRVELYKERKRKIPGFLRDEIHRVNRDGGTCIDHPALSDKEIKQSVRSRDKHASMLKSSGEPIQDYEKYASCLMGSITIGAIREFTYNFCTKLLDQRYLNPSDAKENIPLIRFEILDILADKPSPYSILTNVMRCQFDHDLIDQIDRTIQMIIDNKDSTVVRNEESSSDDHPVKSEASNDCDKSGYGKSKRIVFVARRLNIHPKTIYNWARAGYIHSKKSEHGLVEVFQDEVEKYAAEKHYKRNPYKPRKKSSSGGEYKSNTGIKN